MVSSLTYVFFKNSFMPHLNEHMREKHRISKCNYCAFTTSSGVGLKSHIKLANENIKRKLKI